MDVKYYKELQRNYMVMVSGEQPDLVYYHKKMLSGKTVRSFISVSERVVDGCLYDYYDITSKIALSQMYGSRRMNMDDIRTLAEGMGRACEEVGKFLLDENRIWLHPDHIYYSYAENRFVFVCNVSADTESISEDRALFFDFLLEHVMPEDAEASDFVYRIYEYFENGAADIWDLEKMLPGETPAEKVQPVENIPVDHGQPVSILPDNFCRDHEKIPEDSSLEPEYDVEKGKKTLPVGFMLMAPGILGGGACAAVYMLMELEKQEQILLFAGAGASGLLLVIGIVFEVISRLRTKRGEQPDCRSDAYCEDGAGADDYRFHEHHLADISTLRSKEDRNVKEPAAQTIQDDGKTVLFEPGDGNILYKLYAMDKRNKQHIALDRFPYTIGKMTGYVDCCLEHPTISRIHARLDKNENGIFIQDMNSTNGIYLNGCRIGPNESRYIEPGDEIRLGSLNYCLRII